MLFCIMFDIIDRYGIRKDRTSNRNTGSFTWGMVLMMIKTVIFDIGNVLTGFQWKEYYDTFSYSDEVKERIANATVKSAVWAEYDRGNMTDEEIIEAFVKNDPEIEKEIRESLADISGMLVRFDYAIPWIKSLKENGYQVLVLSNFSHKAVVECAHALDFLPYTDGGILSYKDHFIKPQPEIYALLLERYNLVPDECVFMDDLEENIKGAADAGIHTILFKSEMQAKNELRNMGVKF